MLCYSSQIRGIAIAHLAKIASSMFGIMMRI
jgi:hypothetical protein